MSALHPHVCSAIFGPGGKLEYLSHVLDERGAWNRFLAWPARYQKAVDQAKGNGFRHAAVTVTEAQPAPPPPGTRFDDEGQPEVRHG